MRAGIFIIFCLSFLMAWSQDTTTYLTLGDVMVLARDFHPVVRQGNLQDELAEAELRIAKGQFDPKLSSTYNLKNLRGTEYYNKFHNTLKVPLWFPVDPKVEVYHNTGDFLNPESYVSSSTENWQVAAGVSLPLGKGLFIDERRALVKQARLYGDLAQAEQIKIINKILLSINKAYWDWYLAYEKFQLMEQSMSIAQELFGRVKLDYTFGEAAVVDTVQAFITYQTRKVEFQKSRLELLESKLALSVHLWGADQTPLEIQDDTKPYRVENTGVLPDTSDLPLLLDWSYQNHPDIRKLQAKRGQTEVAMSWYRESLKPELNLSYSLIDAPIYIEGTQAPDWDDNYKFGVDFSFPLFLRKERGSLQKTRAYLENIELDLTLAKQQISAQIRQSHAALMTNRELQQDYEEMAQGYQRLFQAEVFNLETGESDLFKLNIQQDKYIEAQMKYLQALIKFEKLKAQLPYVIGLPYLSYQTLYE